ncbi:MAG: hypothetical protein C5B52_09590 [Bacteroidetes bacterium]|nr:MAG: hypothetical protein C5B52_09590 [Bacteroidota bacterium]
MKNRLLVFTDWYEPAIKAGGPVRSLVNFANNLRDDYDLWIYTGDRDLGDQHPYISFPLDQWIEKADGTHVYYASQSNSGFRDIKKQVEYVKPYWIYLNSMFSLQFSIYPVLLRRFGKIRSRIVIAPRGMLKESALRYKSRKKKFFLWLYRKLGLNKYLIFQATDSVEQEDIKKQFGYDSNVVLIPNFPGIQKDFVPIPSKESGVAHLIFVGRIHPVKNLLFLLEALKHVRTHVTLTIVAAIEDFDYWQACKAAIQSLPNHISLNILEQVPHGQLEKILLDNHLFVLPTEGENFGHAIFEALAAGRPVLISDQTPWKNLSSSTAGWDLPLGDPKSFSGKIDLVGSMSAFELNEWCRGAYEFCTDYIRNLNLKEDYKKLFH